MKKFILLSFIIYLLLIFGCSQNTVKEDQKNDSKQNNQVTSQPTSADNTPVNPHGDGSMQPKQPKQIVVPESVSKKFKAVEIEIKDKNTNKVTTVKASIGQKTSVPNTDITIFVEAYLPDFNMGTENITSASDEEKNPAVKILVETKENKHEGWIFKNFDIHKIEDPNYDFSLVGGVK
ncbi:MAG: hypothetical protein LDL13_05955 [Calditerrivibrio sp.]|nr:hypothetical protein [Calditerrivibrio sp.]MCA1980534.1 hypothetical protein [Calditerrivibrio sp.]